MNIVFDKFRELIRWYLRENSLFILPFVFFSLFIWRISSEIIFKLWKNKNGENKKVLAFTGLYYNGNAKAVYEYLRNKKTYECYWIARNILSFHSIKKQGGRVVYLYFPFTEMKYILDTKALITNDSLLSILFVNSLKKIQLWHGVGPKGEKRTKEDYDEIDAWCVSSEYTKKRHMELWNAPPDKLFVTGLARMDTLLRYLHTKSIREDFCKKYRIPEGKKLLLYAPTWEVGLWPWGDAYEEFEKFCNFCSKNDIYVIFRPHPLFKIGRKLREISTKEGNLLIIDVLKEQETTKLLAIVDILLTDWSSIYTDYFLTNRPIVYFDVDREYFCTPNGRGYGEISPDYRAGEITHKSNEVYNAIKRILVDGNRFKKEQMNLLKIIHGEVDGKISERVSRVIDKVLK